MFFANKNIIVEETERKPNLYAANVLVGIVAVIAIVFALNELGIFEVNRLLVVICLVASLLLFLVMQLIVRNPRLITNPASKYVMMSMVLFVVLVLTVLLNIHAVLAFVLPLLLATQYRSYAVSRLALVGAIVCCGIAPILSYLLGTWNLNFMIGYVQTFCQVTLDVTPGNSIGVWDALWQIMLYWSLPQMLTLGAFGLILYSATKTGIDGVNNQMQVAALSEDLSQQLASVESMQERMLYSLSEIIENRDIETGGHVRRTSELVRILTDAMQNDPNSDVSDAFCINVIKSAPMHDLGKLAIPDTILRKPDKLTDEEYEIIKQHPLRSAEIIEHSLRGIEDEELLETAINIAKYHHERMDGEGYPEGLAGEQIPLEARIMAVADVFDALVNKRCYKEPMAFDEAFQTIEDSMGTQFDPALHPYLLSCREEIELYYLS